MRGILLFEMNEREYIEEREEMEEREIEERVVAGELSSTTRKVEDEEVGLG